MSFWWHTSWMDIENWCQAPESALAREAKRNASLEFEKRQHSDWGGGTFNDFILCSFLPSIKSYPQMELLRFKIHNLRGVGKLFSVLSPKCIKNIPFVRHLEEHANYKDAESHYWKLLCCVFMWCLRQLLEVTTTHISSRIISEEQLKILLTLRDSICQNVLKWHTANSSSTQKFIL